MCFHIFKTLRCVDPRVIGAASFIFVHPAIEKSALFNPSPFSYYIPLYGMFKQHYPTILLLDYYEKVDEKSFFIRVIFKEVGVWGCECITVRMLPPTKLVC